MTVGWLVAEDGAEVDVGKEGGRLRLMSVRIEADVGKEGGRLRLMSVRIDGEMVRSMIVGWLAVECRG